MVAFVVALVVGPPALGADGVQYPGPSGTFSDDDGSTHEANIEALVVAGITKGCGENLFCPGDEITRAQVASFLDRALQLPTTGTDFFSDDDGSVHEAAINRIAAAGITTGCGTRLYCPAEPLKRAHMATLLVRALDLAPVTTDHFTDDDDSSHEANINVLAENGITRGCGTGLYCPNDRVRRSSMASFLARALDLAPARPPTESPWRLELVLERIQGGTTDLQAPAGDDRLFLVTKDGLIRIISDGAFLPEPFLDLTDSVLDEGSEQGLLGLAFHPDYATNRKFYVFYSDVDGPDGHSRVYEYRADASDPDRADPSTARHIITFEQRPTSNTHKGGQMQFGADGYLYIAVGDGGGSKDPFEHGENPQTELGTIVRIDVDVDPGSDPAYGIPPGNPFADGREGLPEVWAYGLRNPWRFSFDGPHIYIGDVGHLAAEEVNVADASLAGINYGWDTMEGTACYEPPVGCDKSRLFIPQVAYSHDEGLAVIGGYVYRGTAIPEMVGRYFYADFFRAPTTWIRTFRYDGRVTEHYDWSRSVDLTRYVWSFGVDGHGELYVLDRWAVWKIVPN